MKIRIHGNSVRYRLSRPEVEELGNSGYLEERTSFGLNQLKYGIKSDASVSTLSATYDDDAITILVPALFTENWAENNVVGLDHHMPLDDSGSLYLLIEKDFKCLDNTSEDQSGNYENPNKTC